VDADGSIEDATYRGVVDVLVALHAKAAPEGLKPHGLDAWLDEVGLFPEWYCPTVGIAADTEGFCAAWHEVLAPVDAQGQHVVELRDYHAENIMLIAGAEGIARYGLLDFQDALIGHPAYDLVSMLEDARRDVPPAVERAMLDRYIAATARGPEFETAYWALGAQRNTRILGVFTRLWQRDGKPHYTRFQRRMWGLLERDLAHPGLAPVKAWFDENVPHQKRADIWDRLGL
jgi:N-acetylmuramate 1-kinase